MILQTLQKLPIYVSPSSPLLLSALEIAFRTQSTFYDSLNLSLAVRENAVITADEKFSNKIKNIPLTSYVLWIETFKNIVTFLILIS